MKKKLNIDKATMNFCRQSSSKIAINVQKYINKHTTVSVERAICRLLGIDGVNEYGVPLPNIVVDNLHENGNLGLGCAYLVGNAIHKTGLTPQNISLEISKKKMDLNKFIDSKNSSGYKIIMKEAKKNIDSINRNKKRRKELLSKYGDKKGPLLYLIVATGNIYEDIIQAKAAARQGADIVAVIRTTGQSLLDYVPFGATTEGFGGTYATQENFKLMRKALDNVGEEVGRYIRLCNYCSGLCMPEIAVMGAFERLDVMLNDALYGILFRDINMKRTMIDQFFSRVINGFGDVIINTGEDNYLTTSDAYEEAHTVLASQFINEQFALLAGLKKEQMGLGHAFEMSPQIKDAFVYEIAQAQLIREVFPKAPLKYMPPTKHMTGDIFMGNVQDTLFNIITVLTGQKIHLLGMLTEAIHTPFMSDRAISIENANYVFRTMSGLSDEIQFKKDGKIAKRANEVLKQASILLKEIEEKGLFNSLSEGTFAWIKRNPNGGKGLDGIAEKRAQYFNPFIDLMIDKES